MFNGTGKIIKSDCIDTVIYTDASGLGFGSYVDSLWLIFLGHLKIDNPRKYVERGPTFDSGNVSIS